MSPSREDRRDQTAGEVAAVMGLLILAAIFYALLCRHWT